MIKKAVILHPAYWEQALGGAEQQILYLVKYLKAQITELELKLKDSQKNKSELESQFTDETKKKRKLLTSEKNENKEAKKSKRFSCVICNASFDQNVSLTKHIKAIHEDIKSYKCKVCGEDFSDRQRLYFHKISKHSSKKNWFPCDYCNLPLSRGDAKKQHELICKEKNKNNEDEQAKCLSCPICNESFDRYSDLTRHVKTVHEGI